MLINRGTKLLVGLGAVALSLAACGGSSASSLDMTKLTELVKSETGASEVRVECPPDIPIQAGLVTECEATIDGVDSRLEITQKDDLGNVRVNWAASGVLNGPDFEAKMAAAVADAWGGPVTVECPQDTPLQAGLVTECIAYDEEYEAVLLITQKDGVGNVDWELVE
ncbi:MAG: DUF4333 domain-containing protein [Candidatus Nanopelagicales bacterium]|jgi:hypothetical protein